MNDTPASESLTEGWPEESDKTELESFARELEVALPQLGDDAMRRIENQMQLEMHRVRRARRRKLFIAGGALAASLLVGLAVVYWTTKGVPRPDPERRVDPPLETVRDTYRVPVLATPAPEAPEQPLIALEANQRLFSN